MKIELHENTHHEDPLHQAMDLMSYHHWMPGEITGCTGCTMEGRDVRGLITLLEFQRALIQASMNMQPQRS